jgi:hypothetical protein
MNQDPLTSPAEIHKAHQTSQERLIYFLLAAAGAAVAFATQKTEGQSLSWWLLPLGLAVLAWASSFYFGCRAVTWSHTAMRREIYLLQVKERNVAFERTFHEDEQINAHLASLDEAILKWSRLYAWQFRFLVAGGVLYCIWRLSELIRNQP